MAETVYQYAVVGVGGDVPEQISACLDDDDRTLLYREYRGEWFVQHFCRRGEIVGSYTLEFRGIGEVENGRVVRSSIPRLANRDEQSDGGRTDARDCCR